MAKVRRAKRFTVVFKIPGTPKACVRFYTRRLTKKVKVKKQTVLVSVGRGSHRIF